MNRSMVSTLLSGEAAAAQLRGTLESAVRRSEGACVVVEGAAGIGKSRQLELARSEAVALGMDVIAVEAAEIDRVAAFCPLAAALGCEQTSGHDRASAALAMSDAIERRAMRRAVLVTVDGVDLVGEPSALALRVLVPRLAHHAVVWLLTRRTCAAGQGTQPAQCTVDWLIDRGARRMLLAPLSYGDIAEIFTHMVGARPDATTLRHLGRSGGNPFLTIERIRSMEADQMTVDDGVAHLHSTRLPTGFLDRVSQWLRELSCDALRLLDAAAVLGRPFTVHQVAGMLRRPAPDIIPAVAEVVVAGFLVDDGTMLAFAHDLLRDAIYDGLYGPVRLALHREACEVLRTEQGSAREIAEHLLSSGMPVGDEAVARLRDAVEQVAMSAPSVAADLLLRALDLVGPEHAARSRLVVDAVQLLVVADRPADARRLYEDTRQTGPELPDEVRQLLESAVTAAPDWPVVPEARRGDEPPNGRRVPALRAPGQLHTEEPVTGAQPGDDGRSRVSRAVVRSIVARAAGDLRASVSAAREAVMIADAEGDPVPCQQPRLWLGSALTAVDRFTEAHAVLEMGLRDWEDHSGRHQAADREAAQPLWHYHLAELCLATGRLDDAVAEAEAGIPVAQSLNSHEAGSALLALLSQLAMHRDDIAAAAGYLDQAQRILPSCLGAHTEDLRWRNALLLMAQDDHGRALRLLDGVFRGFPERLQLLTKERRTAAMLVRSCLLAGQPGKAAAAAAAIGILRDRNPEVVSVAAAADHATGLVRQDVALLRKAVATYERAQRPLDAAAAMEDLAVAEATDGGRSQAVALLERARDAYVRCSAKRDAARVASALRGFGAREGTRRDKAGRGTGDLTEAELRVVRLVADGLTNRQIAHQLFLSPHTVDSHLRHSFAKLGVNSRVELTKQFLLHNEFDESLNHEKA